MRQAKKFKFQATKSEILDSIEYEGFEIKSLKHGITGHVLYKFPSKAPDWELCWTMDIQTAKAGVQKYNAHLQEQQGNSPVESKLS